jgi:hypothetical protein
MVNYDRENAVANLELARQERKIRMQVLDEQASHGKAAPKRRKVGGNEQRREHVRGKEVEGKIKK